MSVPVNAARANQVILKNKFTLEDDQKGRVSAFFFFPLNSRQNRKEIFTYYGSILVYCHMPH